MMDLKTSTTSTLLQQLLDPEHEQVWNEIDRRYRGVIHGMARRAGLADPDAEDVAQETLLRFFRDYRGGRYDRSKGRLRNWMAGIAYHTMVDLQRGQRHQPARRESALVQIPGPNELEDLWEEELQRKIISAALDDLRSSTRLQGKTIEAFVRLVIQEQSVKEVAERLQMSVDSVYAAKHRCAEQLQSIVKRLERYYEVEGSS